LRICDLRNRTTRKFVALRFADYHCKFADLRFVDWHTSEICSDLRLRNESKNLQICDLRIDKKINVPTFDFS
jgi:hypothetical protein